MKLSREGAKSFFIFASVAALQKGRTMKKTTLTTLAIAALGGVIALVRAQDIIVGPPMHNTSGIYSTINYYSATGTVQSITSDRTQATIHQRPIPGFMPAMTMDFPVKDTNELNGISPGNQITFQVVAAANQEWIQNIRRAGRSTPVMANHSAMNCYSVTGIVESITSDRTQATIHYEAIPGFMPAMTMKLPVKNTNELNGVSPGDQITFQLFETAWIKKVKRTGQSAPVMTNSMKSTDGSQTNR